MGASKKKKKNASFLKENQFSSMRVSILPRKGNVHKLALEKYELGLCKRLKQRIKC